MGVTENFVTVEGTVKEYIIFNTSFYVKIMLKRIKYFVTV
jgi:hypothetical protein